MIHKIYTLEHPITHEIRYIGKTCHTLEQRLKEHIYDTKREITKKANWIKSLMKIGLKPIIQEVDECITLEDSRKLEIFYISLFKSWGFNLTNLTEGGECNYISLLSPEEKKKRYATFSDKFKGSGNPFFNKSHSEDTKKLISQKNLGQKRDDKFKKRRAEIMKDWKPSNKVIKRMIEVHGRRVVQLTKDFKFINEFYTIKEASEKTISLGEKIVECCKGHRNSHNKFRWMYKEDYEKFTSLITHFS